MACSSTHLDIHQLHACFHPLQALQVVDLHRLIPACSIAGSCSFVKVSYA